ncbi:MAG: hypothetical protein WCI05_17510, partial [Myxococcales bacterium]
MAYGVIPAVGMDVGADGRINGFCMPRSERCWGSWGYLENRRSEPGPSRDIRDPGCLGKWQGGRG